MRPPTRTLLLADGSQLSNDPTLLNLADIHGFLAERSYWSKNIPFETVAEAVRNSYCIGISRDGRQLAFARVVTDYITFAYLCDVFVTESERGKGLSKALMDFWLEEPWTHKLRNLLLGTLDAHGLYKQYGFGALAHPDRFMQISRPEIYGDTFNTCR